MRSPSKLVVFALLALVLALRVMHFSSALQSPLSYQPGPDEDYYLRLGEAVASGHGANSSEFTFMDPGYGYVLGALFKLIGVNVFAVYLLQALLDTATAYGILTMGRILGRARAGLLGALLYAVTSTAIMFSATLLKETWVASFLTWWAVGALAVHRTERRWAWASFGLLCGIGIALRSTLSLLALVGLLLPGITGRTSNWTSKGLLMLGGLLLSLAPWSLRNYRTDGALSPLPHNGGIVLHQAYNAQNPASAIWIPAFVNYYNPSEIWRGYAAEADRRVERDLSPPEVDGYWRHEALVFIRSHPKTVLEAAARKSLSFLADSEIPNNRSAAEERLFSPVLEFLPPPAVWLLAMGLPGLVWFALQDRRAFILAVPIAVSWITVALFWAEDRFRFHAVPLLALCSGLFIDAVLDRARHARQWQLPAFTTGAVITAAASVYLGGLFPPPSVRWDHIVWGYIKMGKTREAQALADRIAVEQPDNGPIIEAQGYMAAAARRYEDAARDYTRAVALRPRSYLAHYNLAKALIALGDKTNAGREAAVAMTLSPSVETRALIAQIAAFNP